MIGADWNRLAKLSCMPTNAPAIVGSIDSASSQYVLRRTVFCEIGSVTWSLSSSLRPPIPAPGVLAGIGVNGVWRPGMTGSNFGSMVPPNAARKGQRLLRLAELARVSTRAPFLAEGAVGSTANMPPRAGDSSGIAGAFRGGVAEWFKARVLKTREGATLP